MAGSRNPSAQRVLVSAFLERMVGWCVSRPRRVTLACLIMTVVSGIYLSNNLSIRTDLDGLIARDLPWRQAEAAIEKAFPQMGDDIIVVIDGDTPERADAASAALAKTLAARKDLFAVVDEGDHSEFFRREGLLFQSLAEVRKITASLIEAQPLLGPVASDPSLRGLAGGVEAILSDAEQDPTRLVRLARPLATISDAITNAGQRRAPAVSWQALLSGEPVDREDLRRIVRLSPKVDYSRIAPGEAAGAAIRQAAHTLGLSGATGVHIRLTGALPMADDELATLGDAVGPIAALSLGCMTLVLFLATRSPRLILAVGATVFAGLLATTAAGLLLYGRFNLISVAFLPLFVGLSMDFAVQFAVRYRAVAAGEPDLALALRRSAGAVGGGVALAAVAAAIGFLSFLPTAYKGVSELGGVAGLGMIIALVLTMTLLPALIRLLEARPPAPRSSWTPMTQVSPRWILRMFVIAGLASLLVAPLLTFDFNPLSLRNPHTESVATFLELSRKADTTPATLDVLQADLPSATALASRLAKLSEVRRAVTLSDMVPMDQPEKLALVSDAALLLDTTVTPFDVAPPPSDAELVLALRSAATRLHDAAASPGQIPGPAATARRAADVLERLAAATPAVRSAAQAVIMRDLPASLDEIRIALSAEPVSLATLPADLRRAWVSPSGAARIEIWPRGDPNNSATLDHFVAAVRKLAPNVSGTPVTVAEAGATVLRAFLQAAGLSMLAIAILLFATTRSVSAVLLTLAPVLMTLLLTLATYALIHQSINLENIIALPLVLGIGVSFNIYMVSAWRSGAEPAVKSNLARATLYSALTTATAFAALLCSAHPGTASLGLLLTVALGWTMVTSLVLQPALLDWAMRRWPI